VWSRGKAGDYIKRLPIADDSDGACRDAAPFLIEAKRGLGKVG
jgi:hypothetical protein